MANKYFQFKQFTIHQDNCAMKVCTDACLFGALVASSQVSTGYQTQTANCLDIGAGTGLLSLMYAQRNPFAVIDAVEIHPAAALQAKQNFEASNWKDRLHIINADINVLDIEKKYHLIICNPPFFEDDLRSGDEAKNAAKHDASLTLQELVKVVSERLTINGSFAVLLPQRRVNYFENEALQQGLHATRKISVRQTPEHDLFRVIMFFSKGRAEQVTTEMSIRRTDGGYTADFIELLKDYYLHL